MQPRWNTGLLRKAGADGQTHYLEPGKPHWHMVRTSRWSGWHVIHSMSGLRATPRRDRVLDAKAARAVLNTLNTLPYNSAILWRGECDGPLPDWFTNEVWPLMRFLSTSEHVEGMLRYAA